MWFGTWGGLDRFDGYTFTTFKPDRQDSTALCNQFVWSLCEDSLKNLWVGTYGGLDRLDRRTGAFTHYKNNARNPSSLAGDTVKSLFVENGLVWVGTNVGLIGGDPATDLFPLPAQGQ
jgi:ligand-binding sensor domain-containing protein